MLKKETVVVTGGRRGIGKAIVEALHGDGYTVIAVAKSKDRGELGDLIPYVSCDLSIHEQRLDLLEKIGGCDILINNAGIAHNYPLGEYPLVEWYRIFEVNVHAVCMLSSQAARTGCKRIVNIGSISGLGSARNISGYTATKHALVGLTKAMSNEFAPRGCTVNCILPGFIRTDMLELADEQTIVGRIPVGRIGSPEDIVPLVKLLISDEAAYMTGGIYPVDGGWLAR
jgi:2-deoxy-D-gluconate 3-dehydrogenase